MYLGQVYPNGVQYFIKISMSMPDIAWSAGVKVMLTAIASVETSNHFSAGSSGIRFWSWT